MPSDLGYFDLVLVIIVLSGGSSNDILIVLIYSFGTTALSSNSLDHWLITTDMCVVVIRDRTDK